MGLQPRLFADMPDNLQTMDEQTGYAFFSLFS